MDESTRHCSLRELIDAAKNRLAIDGLWFLAVEEKYGLEAVIECDKVIRARFSVIEAREDYRAVQSPRERGSWHA
jgi:hypothetical protein